MSKQIKNFSSLPLCIGVVLTIFLINCLVLAWTEPSASPPNNNVAAPLNVGNTGQSKSGGLIINTGGAAIGLVVDKGNVGIGISSPSRKLDVNGNMHTIADIEADGKIVALGNIQAGGAVIIGNTSEGVNGAIRFTGSGFEGYYNGKWNKLGGSGTNVTLTGSAASVTQEYDYRYSRYVYKVSTVHISFVKDGHPFTFAEVPQVSITNPQTDNISYIPANLNCAVGTGYTQKISNVTVSGFDLQSYSTLYRCGYESVSQSLVSGWSATGPSQ
jgi:hypothetical protein